MAMNGFQLVTARVGRLTAVACFIAMTAAACASTTTTSTVAAERTADPASAPLAIPPPSDTVGTAPEYGSSLEEWGHSNTALGTNSSSPSNDAENASGAETIIWEDLIPPGFSGQEIMGRYEERLEAVEPGSPESTALFDEMQAEFDPEAVNDQLDGQQIRLAGFVAPLTFDGDIVTEFLLVPTYGACIHVPPPPPNQTIMVSVDKANGLTTDEAWGAVWVEGTMLLAPVTTDLASASYTITNATSGVYTDF